MTTIEILIFTIFGLLAPNLTTGTDYCKIKCPHDPKAPHTACNKCPIAKIILEPKQMIFGQTYLTAEEQAEIVKVHNQMRSDHALGKNPGYSRTASNMEKLTWDSELAGIAQCWADSGNKLRHDECRDIDLFAVGQNLGVQGYTTFEAIKKESFNIISFLMKLWFDEYQFDNERAIIKYDSQRSDNKTIGHFTQMIWGNTNKIGCGKSYFEDGGFYNLLLVCNYGPTGNYLGEPVYKFGKPCSTCPNGSQCDSEYPGLCE